MPPTQNMSIPYGRSLGERGFFFIGGALALAAAFVGPNIAGGDAPPGLLLVGIVGIVGVALALLPSGRLTRSGRTLSIPAAPFFLWDYDSISLDDVEKISVEGTRKKWSNGHVERTFFVVLELSGRKARIDLSKLGQDDIQKVPLMLDLEPGSFLREFSSLVRAT
jgi:hypothetical protein